MSKTSFHDANGHRIRLGRATELNLSKHSFSVLVWIKIIRHNSHNQEDNAILGSNNCQLKECIHLNIRSQRPYMGFYCNDTASSFNILRENWYHLAFVYDLETFTQAIYVNGEIVASEPNHGPLEGNADVYLSEYAGARGLNGKLSQMRIFGRPLKEAEIRHYMHLNSHCLVCIEQAPDSWKDISPSGSFLVMDNTVPIFDNISIFAPKSGNVINQYNIDNNFRSFINNSFLSDVILYVNPSLSLSELNSLSPNDRKENCSKSYFGHRLILACRSEYFKIMFSAEMIESQASFIPLYEIEDEDAFDVFWRLLYSVVEFHDIEDIIGTGTQGSSVITGNVESVGVEERLFFILKLIRYAEQFQAIQLLKLLQFYFISCYLSAIQSNSSEVQMETIQELKNHILTFAIDYNLEILLLFFQNSCEFMKVFCNHDK